MAEVPGAGRDAAAAMTELPPAGPEEGTDRRSGPPVPKPVVKADLLPGVTVAATVALLGLPLGWVWSRLAPPEESTLTGSGEVVPLLVESYHRFDSLAIFLLLSLGVGMVVGFALWMLRKRRGPVILLAGVVGAVLASWLAVRAGTSFAGALYPAPANPRPGDLIEVPPEVSGGWPLIALPFTLSFVYGLAASWNGLDDLGRRSD